MTKETELQKTLIIAVGNDDGIGVREAISGGAIVSSTYNAVLDTPLHYAASLGHIKAGEALLEAGANPDAANAYRSTPLHFAAANNKDDMVRKLLEAKASPSLRNRDGDTPSDLARKGGHVPLSDYIDAQRDGQSAEKEDTMAGRLKTRDEKPYKSPSRS